MDAVKPPWFQYMQRGTRVAFDVSMRVVIFVAGILSTLPLAAQQTTATINMQRAIASCQEGIRASVRMRAEWEPSLRAIENREAEIKAERATLERDSKIRRGIWPFRHTMSAKRKVALAKEIDVKARAVIRDREDARDRVELEQRRVVNLIAQHIKPILERYAREHGYSLVLESGSQETPVLVALNDITSAVVSVYDLMYTAER